MAGKLSPSLMCADLMHLQRDIDRLESLHVEYLHLDFMDGRFVPNITFGTDMIRAAKAAVTAMRPDIHIMALEPVQYFDSLGISTGDYVSIHYEACKDVRASLREIRARGARPMLAISPDTPVPVIVPFLDDIDAVLVMTVYPGFAGQPLAPRSFERIREARALLDGHGRADMELEVDGNVSFDHCAKMRQAGADIFVAGTSSVFQKGASLEETVPRFYSAIS